MNASYHDDFILLETKNNIHIYSHLALWYNVKEQKVNKVGSVQKLNPLGPSFHIYFDHWEGPLKST